MATTPETPSAGQDWRAMREHLIKLYADAQKAAAYSDALIRMGFDAQVELCSSLLDFMDERERAHLTAGRRYITEGA
jgi:hypothetical protein